jgi:hypothetical protein
MKKSPPPKKKSKAATKPKHQARPKRKHEAARLEYPMTNTETETEMPEHVVTQSESTEAGPYAHIDPDTQAEVQKQLNLRMARDRRVPFISPKVPPGLSPNQILAWASAAGTISGSTAADALQTDKPQGEPEEEDDKNESEDEELVEEDKPRE